LTTARTGTPAAISRSITPAHPEASAKAPWTRTTVGVLIAELVPVIADSFRWVFSATKKVHTLACQHIQ
jgi:hypothetical protein